MKKIFTLLLAAILILSSVSLAEDFSALSDEELTELYTRVTSEMADRDIGIPEPAGEAALPEQLPEPAGEPAEVSGDTVLYYNPDGGTFYHLDANCKLVHPKYLPLSGSFTYAELGEEQYKDLLPCNICGAPYPPVNTARPGSFREAVEAEGDHASIACDIDYLAAVTDRDGKYIRMITLLDDHAKELYMAALAEADSNEALRAFDTYAWSLPVSYTEEITAVPKDQAELDGLAGKTVGELMEEGYAFYGIGGGEGLPTLVDLSYGIFIYEFEADVPFEYYQAQDSWDGMENFRVKSGKLSGSLVIAANPDYLADGTYEPQVTPNISVPPLEEYSLKARALDADGYSELLDSLDVRYGQVYMAEGVVHQVLSRYPMKVIINTSEDGKSRPVVIEWPERPDVSPEEGSAWRIYGDVSSACYILPVLTARYTFAGPAENP